VYHRGRSGTYPEKKEEADMRSIGALSAISGVLTTAEKKAILRSMLEGILSDPQEGNLNFSFGVARASAAIATLEKINAAKDGRAIVVAQIEAMIDFENLGDFETKDLIANAFVKGDR